MIEHIPYTSQELELKDQYSQNINEGIQTLTQLNNSNTDYNIFSDKNEEIRSSLYNLKNSAEENKISTDILGTLEVLSLEIRLNRLVIGKNLGVLRDDSSALSN